jgi:hypothetical protein
LGNQYVGELDVKFTVKVMKKHKCGKWYGKGMLMFDFQHSKISDL